MTPMLMMKRPALGAVAFAALVSTAGAQGPGNYAARHGGVYAGLARHDDSSRRA